MKTQKQYHQRSQRKVAEYNKDLMFLRKTTATHYIDCNIGFADAWNREKECNKRIRHQTSIIFPTKQCFENYYDYALKHPDD